MRKQKSLQTRILERAIGKEALEKLMKRYYQAYQYRTYRAQEPTENEKRALAYFLANDVSMNEAAKQYGLTHSSQLYKVALWVLKNQERL